MPLAKPLPAIRQELRELLIEDLPAALIALNELLPDTAEKKSVITALRASLQQLNKDKLRLVIDAEEYALRLAQVSASFVDLLDALTEADFEPPAAAAQGDKPDVKRGSVLYKVPRRMPLLKPSICTIRVAVDEDAILEDLVMDDDVRLRERVEVSERMSAELVDMDGNVFEIKPFNAPQQNVRDTGYTQWTFRVKPLVTGEHQIMVKVSLLEFDENTKEYIPRDVTILETVTIITEPEPEPEDAPLRSSGEQFNLGPAESGAASNHPQSATQTPPSSARKPLRSLAAFVAIIVIGGSVWAFTTAPQELEWWVTRLGGGAEGYAAYIEKHEDKGTANPHLEEAHFRKAGKTGALADLRRYEERYPEGSHQQEVMGKIAQMESEAIDDLKKVPEVGKIEQFLAVFPETNRLPDIKRVVDQYLTAERAELLADIETAYVRSMEAQPTLQKFEQYRQDYPQMGRLADMATAAANSPELLPAIQPAIDQAIEQKVEAAKTAIELEAVLPALQAAGSSQTAERVEQIVAKKPVQIRQQVAGQTKDIRVKVQQRERVQPPPSSKATAGNEAEERDWADAVRINTPQGYLYFMQKYPKSPHTNEALQMLKAFRLNETKTKQLEAEAAERLLREASNSTTGLPTGKETGAKVSLSDGKVVQPVPTATTAQKAAASNRKSGIRDMVFVTGGTFLMGSPESDEEHEKEECPHSVTISSFLIGKYEVTQADWFEVMGTNPSDNQGCNDCPVEQVSWDEVQEFIKTLNSRATNGKKYRLLTEAEWEYAARGGAKNASILTGGGGKYAGGNDIGAVAWYGDNSGSKPHPVGQKNPNELGLYDMSGNVYEWCQDLYLGYPDCQPYGPGSKSRVNRGGGWLGNPLHCRSVCRHFNRAASHHNYVGFRLAAE